LVIEICLKVGVWDLEIMQSALVTGSAGFIGFHLCHALLDGGFVVYGWDNYVTGQKKNIDLLSKSNNFHFTNIDVCKKNNFSEKLDYIFHFASPASPVDFDKLSMEIALTNSIGTLNMLKLAEQKKAYFAYASTSEIYGDPIKHPQPEKYFGNVNPIGPRSCYDESKRLGEAMVADFMRKNKVKGNILRIFNTYGPNMRLDDGRIMSNFITQALQGRDITVYGDGKQTRSMCYVSDLVDAILTVVLPQKRPNEVYNIGKDEEKKVIKIAKMVKAVTDSKSKIVFLPPKADEPSRRRPDLSKLNSDFGWQAKVDFSIGLAKTISFYQKVLGT
jgi:nucleoside-diphosphate-sugar epimerase